MNRRRRALHRQRGQAMAEQLVALLVAGVVIGVIAFFVGRFVTFSGVSNSRNISEADTSVVMQEFFRNGQSAQTPYIPPTDVGNNSNSDGHEIAFYQINPATSAGYFYSYCFKESSSTCTSSQTLGTLQRYEYTWSQLPAHGGSGASMDKMSDSTYSAMTAVKLSTPADYANASKNPLVAAYFAKHTFTFSSAKSYHWGYPGVTSDTNATYVITFTLAASGEKRTFGISRHHIVFGQTVLYGSATPTPNAMCASSCPNASTTLSFQNPIASAQNATIVENNYGTRSTTPPQVYTISGCNGTATYSPGSPITPSNNGTGTATISLAPVKQVAPSGLSCTLVATDNAAQTVPIGVSIGRTYAPGASGGGVVPAGTNASVTVSEVNYAAAAQPTFSVYSDIPASTCTATPSSSILSSDGTFTYTEQFTVTFQQQNVLCYLVFVDTYGQTTNQVSTEQQEAPLQAWPPAIRFPVSGTTVASATVIPTLAERINALFGGEVALAAGCSTAIAYSDGSFTSVLANSIDPYNSAIATDSTGCLNQAVVSLYEAGYKSAFADSTWQTGPCTNSNVNTGSWSPGTSSANGMVSQYTAGGSVPTTQCNLGFQDNNPTPQATPVAAQVVEPCWVVGGSCTWTPTVNTDTAVCNRGSDYTNGWGSTLIVSSSPTGTGTVTNNGNGSYTFTRTSTGSVTLTAQQEYITYTSTATCSKSISYKTVDSITYPSV